MKNLVISAVGDESLHTEWISGPAQFDLCLIYYGNSEEKAIQYEEQAKYFYQAKGMKYTLLHEWIGKNQDILTQYAYVWMPDNDVSISTEAINQLFLTAEKYDLYLCQPAMRGYTSHPFTEPKPGSFMRFTNFVEVLAPLMHINTLLKLKDSFVFNHSGWGYDYLWPYLLGHPPDRIAIIDDIVMVHTKPIGTDYTRFPKNPKKEMKELLRQYKKGIKKDFFVHRTIPGK